MSQLEKDSQYLPFRNIPRFPSYISPESGEQISSEPRAYMIPTRRSSILLSAVDFKQKRQIYFGDGDTDTKEPRKPTEYSLEQAERDAQHMDVRVVDLGISQEIKFYDRRHFQEDKRLFTKLEDLQAILNYTIYNMGAEGNTLQDLQLYAALQVGAVLGIDRVIDTQIKLDKDLGHNRTEYWAIARVLWSSEATIRVGGISLKDLLNWDPKTCNLSSFFNFLVEGQLLYYLDKIDEVYSENQDNIKQEYPDHTKHQINYLINGIFGLLALDELSIDQSYFDKKRPEATEVIALAKKNIRNIADIRARVQDTLLDPNSTDFNELKNLLEGYMIRGGVTEVVFLTAFGLFGKNSIREKYRKISRLAGTNDKYSGFYQDLAEAISDYILESPNSFGLITHDDIPTLLTDREPNPNDILSQDLVGIINQIKNTTSKREYSVDPTSISWDFMVQPSTIELLFSPTNPNICFIKFKYENEDGEKTEIEAYFMKTKGDLVFDINCLADKVVAPQFYNAVLVQSGLIFQNVLNQALEIQAAKRTQKESPGSKLLSHTKKTPAILLSPTDDTKVKVKTRPTPEETGENEESTEDEMIVDKTVINHDQDSQLLIEEQHLKKLNKQLKRMVDQDREYIFEAINDFNIRGIGKFYQLKQRDEFGKPIFVLRANATVPGDSRILAKRIDGTRNFSIYAAGYRKYIYRDLGLN